MENLKMLPEKPKKKYTLNHSVKVLLGTYVSNIKDTFIFLQKKILEKDSKKIVSIEELLEKACLETESGYDGEIEIYICYSWTENVTLSDEEYEKSLEKYKETLKRHKKIKEEEERKILYKLLDKYKGEIKL